MTNSSEQPDRESTAQTFNGPANWFSMKLSNQLQIQQTDAFVEVQPRRDAGDENSDRPPAWTMTLYSAWVAEDDETGSDPASFDPSRLFPGLLRSQEIERLSVGTSGRAWRGSCGSGRGGLLKWLFSRKQSYEWRLWVVEYETIVVVASLQSARGMALSDESAELCQETLESMKFAELLARPPELFRRDVLELARRHFPLLESEATGGFGIRIADSEVNLANFYRSYLLQPDRFREIVLPGIATVVRLQEWGPDQLMPPLDDVADQIMPMLYASSDAEENLDGFVRVPWIGGLCVMFVLDEDETYRFVHEAMLEKWDVDPDDVNLLAMENLERFAIENPLEVTVVGEDEAPKMLVPVNSNAYNTVRLLGSDLHQRLRQILGAELVIGVPNRDFFVAVSMAQPKLIEDVRQRVVADYQSMHHPLTSRLLVISADGVSEYCD